MLSFDSYATLPNSMTHSITEITCGGDMVQKSFTNNSYEMNYFPFESIKNERNKKKPSS